MKVINLTVLLAACAVCQAVSFSTIATVSLTLMSLNKPASCFFGIFRRRKSPPVEETTEIPQMSAFRFPVSGGLFNPFGGFGAGGMFSPSFSSPPFGMFGTRFPPQVRPPRTPMQQPPVQPPVNAPFQHGFSQSSMQRFPSEPVPPIPMSSVGNFRDPRDEEDVPGMNTEEAESFFTLLSETDESKCISRLVCEMGANPASGGEFGQTIVEIIESLKDFPDGSKVSEYNEVLNIGLAEGLSACMSKFSMCDEESYQLVKKAQLEDDMQSE